ncbi:PTS system, glucose subfamily, IIA component [Halobacteroides halobius DSM 5150]|uniref:PTS system, glucose subfamily, IIA component n=1 Tax=Halobacteroides halobius (strain ATCC 35273 / DSM 5150 / MD-1) TaxID=748449 RepID=L0K810_HALHC|nr:PTS glucose transporter subunit IIA [Halobacteroides halobius]AGB41402.1 PTS system, glucose subfamily, IIA component [Halobacteroides halobius DSM 5150]
MFNLFGSKSKEITLVAPLTGEVVDLSEVPDDVFANKVVGDGIAIKPSEGKLVAPVEGVVKQVFPTKHAVGMETSEGVELLMHIGINTVELNGEGFEKLIDEGTKVKPGDELIKFDIDYISENATAIVTPILITNMDEVESVEAVDTKEITAGQEEVLTIKID